MDKSKKLAGALNYSIHQEQFLRVFLEDPEIPLDNNDAERRSGWSIVAIGVNEDECHEIIGVAEGTKEGRESWRTFFVWLKVMLLKAIHAQECKTSAKEKAKQVADKLREMKLTSAAKKVEDGIEENLTYMDFPRQHWTRIRINNPLNV